MNRQHLQMAAESGHTCPVLGAGVSARQGWQPKPEAGHSADFDCSMQWQVLNWQCGQAADEGACTPLCAGNLQCRDRSATGWQLPHTRAAASPSVLQTGGSAQPGRSLLETPRMIRAYKGVQG